MIVNLPLVSIIADFTSLVEVSPSILICSISCSAESPTLAQFATFTTPFFISTTGFPTTKDFINFRLTISFTMMTTSDQTSVNIRNVKIDMEVL